jgi:putative DNA methylase
VFETVRAESSLDFPFTVFYAFKQQESEDESEAGEATGSVTSTGWETMLEALTSSGFSVDGTWPMRTEQPGGLREAGRNSLASSIVLVCRPRPKDAGVASRRDFLAALKRELPEALRNLQKGNIAPVDLAQAAIGPGMAVFSRYARVLETDGSPMSVRTALALISQSLDEVLAEQEGEFDADTRWALAWFRPIWFHRRCLWGGRDAFDRQEHERVRDGRGRHPRGQRRQGAAAKERGTGHRLGSNSRQASDYLGGGSLLDPRTRIRRRIRSCRTDEEARHKSESARDLAYRLYTICERRKRSQDALAYNALVLNWPEITNIAQSTRETAGVQGELI